MENLSIKLIAIFITIFVVGCSKNSETAELVSLTGAMPKVQAELTKSIVGYDTLQKVKLGPWECYAPNHDLDSQLFCTHQGRTVVYIDNTDSFRVTIPKSKASTAFIIATDKDKDGDFDSIQYDGTSETGDILRTVVDENLDGKLDRYTDFTDAKLMLNINDIWYKAKGSKNLANGKYVYHVNIDGQEKTVQWNQFPYKLLDN